jgi:hypothetical protein
MPALEHLHGEHDGDGDVDPVNAVRMGMDRGGVRAQAPNGACKDPEEEHACSDLDQRERQLDAPGTVAERSDALRQERNANDGMLQLLRERAPLAATGPERHDEIGRPGHAAL